MKKRVLSLILALCMLLSCLPAAAFGEEAVPAEEPEPTLTETAPAEEIEEPAEESATEETAEESSVTSAEASADESAGSAKEELTEAPSESAPEESAPAAEESAEPTGEEPTEEEPTAEESSETAEDKSAEEPSGSSEETVPAEESTEEPSESSEETVPEETEGTEPVPEEAEEPAEEALLAEGYKILTDANFPDPHFRHALIGQFGVELTAAEAAKITYLDVSGEDIEDLTGIRFFSGLTELDCSDNELEALSLNSLKNLTTLDCSGNELEHLSVRACVYLTYLYAADNELEDFDVSGMEYLKVLSLSGNPLETLKLNGCEELSSLTLDVDELESLQAKGCDAFPALDFTGAKKLESLDVRDCAGLTSLTVNSAELSTLRVSGCKALTALDCSGTAITSLDITGCETLVSLDCHSCDDLTSLTVRSCSKLETLDCHGSGLGTLSLKNMTSLVTVNCAANELSELDVSYCYGLKTLNCADNMLSSLVITDCLALTSLDCSGNRLSSLALVQVPGLETLDCSDNELTALAIEECEGLKTLTCGNNRLMHLNISAAAGLEAASFGSQHPSHTLTAYFPADSTAYAFADLGTLLLETELSLVSHDLPCLAGKAYLPVTDGEAETFTYSLTYGTGKMEVTVPLSYTYEPPFTAGQAYLLLEQGEEYADLNAFLHFSALSDAFSVEWYATDTEETGPSDVVSLSGDTVTGEEGGTAILYGTPSFIYDSVTYSFAPVRFRVDVAEGTGSAADDVTAVSVRESTQTVELFSLNYTEIELLLERNALKSLASSGELLKKSEIEEVEECSHVILSAEFSDPDAAEVFELRILDDRTLAVVPYYEMMEEAWYSSKAVKSTYRSSIAVKLDNGKTFYTGTVTLKVKQSKPSVSAYAVTMDTLDILSAGAVTSFPLYFKSSAEVIAAEPNTKYSHPLPTWLTLDGEGLALVYAGDEAYKASGYARLLVTLKGWAVKVPVSVSVKAVSSLTMRFTKKHLTVRADGTDSDLVSFTTKPLSARGIDFFRDNAELTEAKEKSKTYKADELFTMEEYYDADTGYYGWYLQVIPDSPADDGRSHSYTVSLEVAGRTVYFYVKVISSYTKPKLTLKKGGTVDMAVPYSGTSTTLTVSNMNIKAKDGSGSYLVEPDFHVTLSSPKGEDITDLFIIDYNHETGKVTVTLDGYRALSGKRTAYLWAEVDEGGYAQASAYAAFTLKESAKANPSFTLKRSGTVDTARASSYVKLVPNVKNYPAYDLGDCGFTFYKKNGRVWEEMTDGDLYFEVTADPLYDCFRISAREPENYALTPGNGYAFTAEWDLGGTLCAYGTAAKPIVIPVRQCSTSFSVTPTAGTLSKSDNASELLITVTAKDLTVNPIASITLDKTSAAYFTVTETETEGVYRLGWNQSASLKKLSTGKTRTVTLQIFVEGNNTQKPNATVKVKVKAAK